jgi:hypothetical protein
MPDHTRNPIRADVKVGFEELGRSLRRGTLAVGRPIGREDRRRARAARRWLYQGERSSDPAVARRVLIEHRQMEWMWMPPFDSWWFRVFSAAGALLFGAALVRGVVAGESLIELVPAASLVGASVFNLFFTPGIIARRAARTEVALAEARALIAAVAVEGTGGS